MFDLELLFKPRSIAVVGASPQGGGAMLMENIRDFAYQGRVYPVNPKYQEIYGYPCYATLLDIPERVDVAVIRINAERCMEIMAQCAAKDIHAAVLFASGFGEMGAEGKALEEQLKQFAIEHDIALCGPNGMGIVNVQDGIPLYMAQSLPKELRKGNIGFIGQSGSVIIGFMGADRGMGYSHIISSGNQTVLEAGDYLQYLVEDEHTSVIGMYLENLGEIGKFQHAATLAREKKKAIIILKAGRSQKGQKSTIAHTGSLAGSQEAFMAFAHKYNLVIVENMEELVENCVLFSQAGYRDIPFGVGVTTISGGHKVLAQDLGEDIGLGFVQITKQTEQTLAKVLPSVAHFENPVDITGMGVANEELNYQVMKALLEDDGIGLVVVLQDCCPYLRDAVINRYAKHATAAKQAAAAYPERPLLFVNGISNGFSPVMEDILRGSNVIMMAGMRNCLIAVRNYMQWLAGCRQQQQMVVCRPQATRRDKWRAVLAAYRGVALPDDLAFDLLADYDLPVVPFRCATDWPALRAAAQDFGYPLVLKGIFDGVAHKSEWGLIRLNLQTDEELHEAYQTLSRKKDELAQPFRCFLLQMMLTDGTELMLSVKREPGYGYVVVAALGGIFVEILQDSALRILPVTEAEMLDLFKDLRAYPVLAGARGRQPVDFAALQRLAAGLNSLATELDGLLNACEINPALASAAGVWALDALLDIHS